MRVIDITKGIQVKTPSGTTGTVVGITTERTGKRGRPAQVFTVQIAGPRGGIKEASFRATELQPAGSEG